MGGTREELWSKDWATPRNEWLKPVEEMGQGNLTEISLRFPEKEDLRKGLELLTVWTGPAKKTKV